MNESAEAGLRAEAPASGAEKSKVDSCSRAVWSEATEKKEQPTHLAVRPGRSEPVLRRWEPAAAL